MHLRSLVLPLAAVATTCMWADEGIWLFDQVPQARLRQSHGVTLSEPLLERLRLSSIRMNNGGSGSFVSPDGLIFTNHHVASECIQQLSSKEADYMKNGGSGSFVSPDGLIFTNHHVASECRRAPTWK